MRIETLADHDLSSFRSGAVELDDWLIRRATNAHKVGDTVVRVAVTDGGRVVGFHGLCASSVDHQLASGSLRRNAPDPVPVLLLARLAVAVDAQGRGVGSALLSDVARRSVAAATMVGFRALVIHCRDNDALSFYSRSLPVSPLPLNPLHVFVPIRKLASAIETGRSLA